MKLSENTINVLKNFSAINQSLLFRAGNTIRTVSPSKNILAQAVVEENIPRDFGIYELNQFLGLVSLFESGELEFGESAVTIKDGSYKAKYTYSDPANIKAPPDKNIVLPSEDVKFTMSKEDLRRILNGANQLQSPNLVVRGAGGAISLVSTDVKEPSCNEFSHALGETTETFQFVFKTENFKFIQDDYDVTISARGIAHFVGSKVEYWVATEASSKYGE
jgi:hypothetical protein